MKKEFFKFIEDGINIRKDSDGTYTVFTVPTQHFNIDSLAELTVERFEMAAKDFEKRQILECKLMSALRNLL